MAVQQQRVCDWPKRGGQSHGTPVDSPTRFTLEDKTYELDLCDEDREAFLNLFEKAISLSRPVGVRNVSNTRRLMMSSRGAFTTKDVRAWLKKQPGYKDISSTGRLSQDMIDLYVEAHQ